LRRLPRALAAQEAKEGIVKKLIFSLLFVMLPVVGFAATPGVRFELAVLTAGKPIAARSVWVPFGQPATIEVPGKVRVVMSAQQPKGDISLVKATFYSWSGGKWARAWSPSMDANITETPSFEGYVQGKTYRVVLMPRAAAKPMSQSS
jgi:hypothetical protein